MSQETAELFMDLGLRDLGSRALGFGSWGFNGYRKGSKNIDFTIDKHTTPSHGHTRTHSKKGLASISALVGQGSTRSDSNMGTGRHTAQATKPCRNSKAQSPVLVAELISPKKYTLSVL